MSEFNKKIKDITGLDTREFIKVWKTRDKEWNSGMKHNEEHGLKCLRMLNGQESWDKKLLAQRVEQRRPALSENLLPDFINKTHGEFCMTTPQATVDPVDGRGDPKVATVLKGLIYNTSYQFSGSSIYEDAFYSLISSGIGAWRVGTRFADKNTMNVEATKELIQNPFSIRWDLACKSTDLRDKKWVIILTTMEEEEFIKEYGEEAWKPKDWNKTEGSDKELWYAEKKVTLAEVWWVQEDTFTLYEHPDGTTSREKPSTDVGEGGEKLRSRESADLKIYSCIISPTDILSEPTEWPDYTDDPIIPIVIVHGRKIVIAGKVYYKSLISDGLEIQQLHNYWITAITEALALQPDAPYLATQGQIEGFPEWKDLSTKTRVMRYKYDPKAGTPTPQRQAPPTLSGAMLNMPQYTRQALRDVIGLQQASLGISGNEKSGIAIQKRKQEGDAGKYSFVKNFTRGMELDAKILVNIYPSIMDTPRTERIMGDNGVKSLAYIHQDDPETGEFLDLSVGKYDVRVTTGPNFATQRDEAKDLMVQLIQYLGPIAPQAVMALTPKFLKLIDAPDADEMVKIAVATLPPELRVFYQNEDEKGKPKLPPEILSQMQAMGQQLQQAQQLLQQQAQELDSLKKEEAFKVKKLESEYKLDAEKLKIEREKVMKEMTLKREQINADKEMQREKIDANIEIEITKLMETIKAQRELKDYQSKLPSKEIPSEQPSAEKAQ